MSLPGYSPLPAVYRACLKHAKAHGAREEDLATSSSYRKFRELALEDRLPGVIRLGQWWGQDYFTWHNTTMLPALSLFSSSRFFVLST